MNMPKKQKVYIVCDSKGQIVSYTCGRDPQSAVIRAESDHGGLDEAWEDLLADGYHVYEAWIDGFSVVPGEENFGEGE
jgi:hypothetical protein